jgi:hypothetical protein
VLADAFDTMAVRQHTPVATQKVEQQAHLTSTHAQGPEMSYALQQTTFKHNSCDRSVQDLWLLYHNCHCKEPVKTYGNAQPADLMGPA